MFNKKIWDKIKLLDKHIGELYDKLDAAKRKSENVNCIKCGMLGLKSKMKCDKKVISNEVGAVFNDSLKIYYYDDTIVDKIITEYTCVHCQKKNKKK